MDLHDSRIFGHHGRDHGALERPGGGNHAVGFDHAIGRFDPEAGASNILSHFLYLDAAADGRSDLFRVGDKIIRHLLLGSKSIRIEIGELHARKPIMPGGTIGNQRVPSFRAPAFRNSVALQNEVRHTAVTKVFTHSQTGLAAADNERLYFFN